MGAILWAFPDGTAHVRTLLRDADGAITVRRFVLRQQFRPLPPERERALGALVRACMHGYVRETLSVEALRQRLAS